MLTVAHRLNTVIDSDQILVMEKGYLVVSCINDFFFYKAHKNLNRFSFPQFLTEGRQL